MDIWAVGILLYFMLVGVTPFRGSDVSKAVHKTLISSLFFKIQMLKENILEGTYTVPDYVSAFAQVFEFLRLKEFLMRCTYISMM